MGWSQYGAQYWIRTVLPNPRSTRFLESMGNVEVKKGKEIRRREHVGTRREVGRKEGRKGMVAEIHRENVFKLVHT